MRIHFHLTNKLHQPESDAFFIIYKKPYGPASKQTLRRWVKNTLHLAGVDITFFTAHSTRHTSTSAAWRKGLALEIIKNAESFNYLLTPFWHQSNL